MPEIEHKTTEQPAKPEQKHDKDVKAKGDDQEPKQIKTPCLPFPQRIGNTTLDRQFQKVLKVFKQLDITIPFLEAIT